MAQLPLVVVCAVVVELDVELDDALVELLVLDVLDVLPDVVAVVAVVALESSLDVSSADDLVAPVVVALAATWVVDAGWSATIAPPRPRKPATLSAAAVRRARSARGFRRRRAARLVGGVGVLLSFMRATVNTERIGSGRVR
jgi:hypothetical protein